MPLTKRGMGGGGGYVGDVVAAKRLRTPAHRSGLVEGPLWREGCCCAC